MPEVLRYATSIRLTFKIRDDEPESIYPPILEVSERALESGWERRAIHAVLSRGCA